MKDRYRVKLHISKINKIIKIFNRENSVLDYIIIENISSQPRLTQLTKFMVLNY